MISLKLAFRALFKTPFVTAIAVLSLALGIGANAAIFSLFDQIRLQSLPVQDLKTLDQQARERVFLDRMISTLTAAFGALATLLAAIGLYGVLAYTVAQRTREIGLRMALGAAGGKVRGMVLKQVGIMILIGGAVGIAGALALGRGAQSLLFEMEGSDPLAFSVSAVLLAAVALGAGYVPARRASRVDPMKALRYE
jgi:ABC-type antimicrobial peptide transport system permease subunit